MVKECSCCKRVFLPGSHLDICSDCLDRHQPVEIRHEPAKIEVLTCRAVKRYYKLEKGDILDIDTKTIINRDSLKALLDS